MLEPKNERRRELRVKLSQRWRIRIPDTDFPVEVCTTNNISRCGLYFVTYSTHYLAGMDVYVIRNFQPHDQALMEEEGTILRVDTLKGERYGVAILLRNND